MGYRQSNITEGFSMPREKYKGCCDISTAPEGMHVLCRLAMSDSVRPSGL